MRPQLHHLRPMHQALTAERHEVRLRRAPVGQRCRPLLRATQIEELLAYLDHRAVDAPSHNRRHLAGLDGDHRLVQQRHALGGLPQPQQRPATANQSERRQILVAEAVTDLGGLTEGGVRGGGVALGKALHRDRHEQIPLLHTVQVAVVQKSSLSASLPTRYAAVASRSRSSGASGVSRLAATSLSKASAHARRPKDSRPRSSVSAVVIHAPRRQGRPIADTRTRVARRTSGTLPPPGGQQEAQ
jgi:hypothetical protein